MIYKINFIKFFFIFCFIYNSYQAYYYVIDEYTFIYLDWLINYSGGFVRRGLAGEIFITISNFTGIKLKVLFIFFFWLILGLFYFKSYNFLSKIEKNIIIYLLIVSPFFYVYYFVNHGAGLRKEFILYIFFIFLISEKNIFSNKNILWKYSLIYPLLILIHEGIIFYLPFYIFFIFLIVKKENIKSYFLQIFFCTTISVFFAFLSLKNSGLPSNTNAICESIKMMNSTCNDHSAIAMFKYNLNDFRIGVLEQIDKKNIFGWIAITIYGFFPIIFITFFTNFQKEIYLKKFFLLDTNLIFRFFILLNFILILPLFVIAYDWGRWLAIYYHLLSLIILFLFKNNLIRFNNFFQKKNFFLYKKKLSILSLVLLFFFGSFLTPGLPIAKSSIENIQPYSFIYYKNYKKMIKKLNK